MNRYGNPELLTRLWRRQAEINIETGLRPLLGLGLGGMDVESLISLLALKELARRPAGLSDAQIVVGGEGELWLAALYLRPALHATEDANAIDITYAGSDQATHAASLTIAALPASGTGPAFLPAGMAWSLTSSAVPGSERSDTEYLPFQQRGATFAPVSAASSSAAWSDRIEAWIVLAVAFALVVAAIVV